MPYSDFQLGRTTQHPVLFSSAMSNSFLLSSLVYNLNFTNCHTKNVSILTEDFNRGTFLLGEVTTKIVRSWNAREKLAWNLICNFQRKITDKCSVYFQWNYNINQATWIKNGKLKLFRNYKVDKQAGAELCQAQGKLIRFLLWLELCLLWLTNMVTKSQT